jgi:hypothetical protein
MTSSLKYISPERKADAMERQCVKIEVITAVTSLPILVTLITTAICSAETSVLSSATRRYIPEGDFFFKQKRVRIID